MFQDHRKKDIKTSHNATLGMLLYWGSHIAHIYIFSTLAMYSHIKIKRWAPIPLIITFQYFCISDGHPFSLPLEHSCPLRGWKKFRWGEGVALVPLRYQEVMGIFYYPFHLWFLQLFISMHCVFSNMSFSMEAECDGFLTLRG